MANVTRFMKERTQRRPTARNSLTATLLALVILAATALAVSPVGSLPNAAGAEGRVHCSHTGARPARVSLRELRISTRCLFNRVRERRGLRTLGVNRKLRRVATGHSLAMVKRRFFAHGSTGARISRSGYLASARSWAYGEVIAYGCHRDGSARFVFRRWMRSPTHRAIILTPRFRELGVGVSRGDPSGGGGTCATYTVDLGIAR